MKILYLAHRIPYPPNKGDKIRSFNEIRYLSQLCEIDLICLADEAESVSYGKNLKKYCTRVRVVKLNRRIAAAKGFSHLLNRKPISAGYFYSQQIQHTVDQWVSDTSYDAVICFSSPMAEYVFRSKKLWSARGQGSKLKAKGVRPIPRTVSRIPRLIMDFCDVDSDKWAQYAESSRFPKSLIYSLENRKLATYERKIAQSFDHSIFISEKEAEIFREQHPDIKKIMVIPNGVDYKFFSPEQSIDTLDHGPCPILLFTGAMDYHANVDGVIWFCSNIYPQIKRNLPNAKFYIVGSNPNQKVRRLINQDGIKVTGYVEDVRPYYQMADICVIPLRLARGVQNKVLEAMAMSNAVVTTSKAIQGINAVDGEHLMVCDEATDFSRGVLTLLEDARRRREIGSRARQFVETNFDWQRNMQKLGELISPNTRGIERAP